VRPRTPVSSLRCAAWLAASGTAPPHMAAVGVVSCPHVRRSGQGYPNAFALWDLSNLSLFTPADGRVVTDAETVRELAISAPGVMSTAALDIEVAKLMRTVEAGMGCAVPLRLRLRRRLDLLLHRRRRPIDPADVKGVIPPAPMAYWGCGTIPDPYGRGWASDDSEARAPSRPRQPHAMLEGGLPGSGERPPLVDVDQPRVGAGSRDVAGIVRGA
jgi:hypothetical protein